MIWVSWLVTNGLGPPDHKAKTKCALEQLFVKWNFSVKSNRCSVLTIPEGAVRIVHTVVTVKCDRRKLHSSLFWAYERITPVKCVHKAALTGEGRTSGGGSGGERGGS